jgi:hypothetical protein
MQKSEVKVTRCCGPSSGLRPSSFFGEPMTKLSARTTTSSGHHGSALVISSPQQ